MVKTVKTLLPDPTPRTRSVSAANSPKSAPAAAGKPVVAETKSPRVNPIDRLGEYAHPKKKGKK